MSADAVSSTRNQADLWLSVTAAALVGAGLVMVLSASQAVSYEAYQSSFYVFLKQGVFAVVGTAALIVLSRVDYHRLRRLALPSLVAAMALMVAVFVPHIGVPIERGHGAQRWINLGPLGTLQPSEVLKLALVVYLSHWAAKRGDRIRSFTDGFLPLAIMLAAALGVLALQKDLGTALVVTTLCLAVYFSGGAPKRHLLLLSLILVAVFAAMVYFERYRLDRLAVYLDPFLDIQGRGMQSAQALIGLGSGGLTGVGLGHSVQKYLWLPQADTDFIFAIVGEETGLIGSTLLLGGFVMFAIRGYRAAMRAPDRMGVMLACGITTWITFQALINIGVVTNTLPITGVPLPFISVGGSALAVSMAAVGVLLNVSGQGVRQSYISDRRQGKAADAAVDSGRRHRRAPVAGTRRGPGVSR
jgi:cell division protein FtsW